MKDEFWWGIDQTIEAEGWEPNMILDDGGDLTLRMHENILELLKNVKGLSEETTTGVSFRAEWLKKELYKFLQLMNDSVTKSKFDNLYGCKEFSGWYSSRHRCNDGW